MAQVPVFTVSAFPAGVDNTQHQQILYGLVTFTGSGGYTSGGGLPITWTFLNTDGSVLQPVASSSTPSLVYFQTLDTSVNSYNWNKAANKFFAQTAGAEVTGTPTLSGAISFEAHFARGI